MYVIPNIVWVMNVCILIIIIRSMTYILLILYTHQPFNARSCSMGGVSSSSSIGGGSGNVTLVRPNSYNCRLVVVVF